MYRNILLAVDGSSSAEHALLEAAKFGAAGAAMRVVVVVDTPAASFPAVYGVKYDAGLVGQAMREAGHEVLSQAVARLASLGVTAEGRLVDLTDTPSTNIPAALLKAAAEWPADLLVIGTHGRGGLKRLLLGSVAEHLIRTASLPVLLVRGPAEASA